MSDQWFYRIYGQEFGPISLDLVRSLVFAGTIAPDDEVRHAARSNWILACAAAELRDAIKATPGNLAVERRSVRDEWFCRGAAGDYGPLNMMDLIQLAVDGELKPEEEIKSSTDDEWKQVRSIRRLIELLPFPEQIDAQNSGFAPPKLVDSWSRSNEAMSETETLPANDECHPATILQFSALGIPHTDPDDSVLDWGDEFQGTTESDESLTQPSHESSDFDAPLSEPEPTEAGPWNFLPFPGVRASDQTLGSSIRTSTNLQSLESLLGIAARFEMRPFLNPDEPISWVVPIETEFDTDGSLWSGWMNCKEFGPVSYSELLTWAVTGRLLPSDFVRRGNDGPYLPAVNIPCLFTVRAAANSLFRRTVSSAIAAGPSSTAVENVDCDQEILSENSSTSVVSVHGPGSGSFFPRENGVFSRCGTARIKLERENCACPPALAGERFRFSADARRDFADLRQAI